jgi:AcrR family transcriptional regulator
MEIKKKLKNEEELAPDPQLAPVDVKEDNAARVKLMEVSKKLFAQHGLNGTSTRDISKESGLNISLISYYFGGKEGLYKAVLTTFAEESKKQFMELAAGFNAEGLDRESFRLLLRQFLQGMFENKMRNPEIGLIVDRELMSGSSLACQLFENVFSDVIETIVGFYKMGQRKGFIRKEINPYVLFICMIHSSDQYMRMIGQTTESMQSKLCQIPEQSDDYLEQLYLIFVKGVLV